MPPLTTTEYAVLGTIAFGERSGYDLARSAERSIGAMWSPSRSQIYKVLPRLVELRCARVRSVEQGARPDKALYAITSHGRAVLGSWVAEVEDDPPGGPAVFLMKIFFGWAAAPEAQAAQLAAYERSLHRLLDRYRETEASLAEDEPVQSRVALRHGVVRAEATLAWVAEARELLGVSERVG